MERPSDLIIQRVLNEKAQPREAEQVAAWFATREGQAWLSVCMDRDAERISENGVSHSDAVPTGDLLRRIDRIVDSRRRRMLLFRIAAVVLPCALVVGGWIHLNSRLGWPFFDGPAIELVAASHGEHEIIVFQDGTKVWLNSGSEVCYPSRFGIDERRIRLSGEAFFEVTPNARRPFIVETNGIRVKVVGTSFNVRAYDNEQTVDVVLKEGKVQFSHDGKSVMMAPGQKLVYNKFTEKIQSIGQVEMKNEMLWLDRVICFRDAPLSEVVPTLERWYDVRFSVMDASAYECNFSLQTSNIPLSELLQEMEKISPLSFEMDGKTVRVRVR